MLVKLTINNFYTELMSGLKIVEFYAPWCGYCKKQDLELQQMDRIWIGQVNTDEEKELLIRNAISSFPTFLIYDNGKEMERFGGYHSKEEIMNKLLKYLK